MPHYILTLTCQDRPGIIHAVAGALLDVSANVLEQAQFTDQDSGLFAMRTRFEAPGDDAASVRRLLEERAAGFAPTVDVRLEQSRRRVLVMVSKYDHCLVDLLYRYDNGELPVEIPSWCPTTRTADRSPSVTASPSSSCRSRRRRRPSRRPGCWRSSRSTRSTSSSWRGTCRCCPTTSAPGSRAGSSTSTTRSCPGSREPGPYHQAHARGVKLIGATAHFVTADLDEGPIIEQGVQRVDHSATPDDLAEIGRDVERLVLARAVRLFAEDRIVLDGRRTIVFVVARRATR